jgi:hypothetical protein
MGLRGTKELLWFIEMEGEKSFRLRALKILVFFHHFGAGREFNEFWHNNLIIIIFFIVIRYAHKQWALLRG